MNSSSNIVREGLVGLVDIMEDRMGDLEGALVGVSVVKRCLNNDMDIMEVADWEDLGGLKGIMEEGLVGHKATLEDVGVEGREVIRVVEGLKDRAGQDGKGDLGAGDNVPAS
jgi:hypothetical protein